MLKIPPTSKEFEEFKLKKLKKHQTAVKENIDKHHDLVIHSIIMAMKRGDTECTLPAIPIQYRIFSIEEEILTLKDMFQKVFGEFVMNAMTDTIFHPNGYKVSWMSKEEPDEEGEQEEADFILSQK